MPHPQIKFGTDGWRAVIADDFTFANVRIAAEAIAAYVHAKEDPAKGLCIGYDTRFGSKAFARTCAEVVAATGIPVHVGQRHHAHPGAQLRRARAQGRRRHHDHLLAQSGAVERRQVQGLVRRLRQALHDRRDRVLSRPARAARRAACPDRGGRFPATVPQGHRELRQPRRAREIRHEVRHRLDVRRGPHLYLRHLHPPRRGSRADSRQSRSALSRHQSRAHRAAHPRAGRGGGGQRLPGRPVHRRRRRPHRRDR